MTTPNDFALAFLRSASLPATDNNMVAVVAWEKLEGGHWSNSATFNPLNTTQGMAGSTTKNADGVQAFTSWDQGVAASVKTLQNGLYAPIIEAFRQNLDPDATLRIVDASPWGTHNLPSGPQAQRLFQAYAEAADPLGAPITIPQAPALAKAGWLLSPALKLVASLTVVAAAGYLAIKTSK